eukprot:6698555-Prymnesium_polylepis.1
MRWAGAMRCCCPKAGNRSRGRPPVLGRPFSSAVRGASWSPHGLLRGRRRTMRPQMARPLPP